MTWAASKRAGHPPAQRLRSLLFPILGRAWGPAIRSHLINPAARLVPRPLSKHAGHGTVSPNFPFGETHVQALAGGIIGEAVAITGDLGGTAAEVTLTK